MIRGYCDGELIIYKDNNDSQVPQEPLKKFPLWSKQSNGFIFVPVKGEKSDSTEIYNSQFQLIRTISGSVEVDVKLHVYKERVMNWWVISYNYYDWNTFELLVSQVPAWSKVFIIKEKGIFSQPSPWSYVFCPIGADFSAAKSLTYKELYSLLKIPVKIELTESDMLKVICDPDDEFEEYYMPAKWQKIQIYIGNRQITRASLRDLSVLVELLNGRYILHDMASNRSITFINKVVRQLDIEWRVEFLGWCLIRRSFVKKGIDKGRESTSLYTIDWRLIEKSLPSNFSSWAHVLEIYDGYSGSKHLVDLINWVVHDTRHNSIDYTFLSPQADVYVLTENVHNPQDRDSYKVVRIPKRGS